MSLRASRFKLTTLMVALLVCAATSGHVVTLALHALLVVVLSLLGLTTGYTPGLALRLDALSLVL